MGFQALAFVMAFAVPALLIGPISEKEFSLSTKWLLAVIAASLGAVPLFLVPFAGAFLQYIDAIRISYLVYALIAVAVTGYASWVVDSKVRELAAVPSSDEADGPDEPRLR
ncbi:MAG: hypothetical protein ACRDIY_08515 [Chloroflexota bacterium]